MVCGETRFLFLFLFVSFSIFYCLFRILNILLSSSSVSAVVCFSEKRRFRITGGVVPSDSLFENKTERYHNSFQNHHITLRFQPLLRV